MSASSEYCSLSRIRWQKNWSPECHGNPTQMNAMDCSHTSQGCLEMEKHLATESLIGQTRLGPVMPELSEEQHIIQNTDKCRRNVAVLCPTEYEED